MIEAFYRENFHIVYGYLLSLCGDKSLAEELSAQTFFKALERIDRYDPHCKPATWLCTIGRNIYYNYCKRQKRLLPLEEQGLLASPSPELVFIQREQVREIMEVIASLPEMTRRVVLMRLEGMSFREIGLALDKTENWTRVTYYRAKIHILKEMEEKS